MLQKALTYSVTRFVRSPHVGNSWGAGERKSVHLPHRRDGPHRRNAVRISRRGIVLSPNWSVKRRYDTIWALAGDSQIVAFGCTYLLPRTSTFRAKSFFPCLRMNSAARWRSFGSFGSRSSEYRRRKSARIGSHSAETKRSRSIGFKRCQR